MQKKLNYLLLLLLSLNILYVFLGAYLYPLASIDAISIWYLKAKALFINHGIIPVDILKDKTYLYSHPQYPILLPFSFYIAYLALGGINESIIAFINPLFYLLIIIVIYKILNELKFTTTLSLLFTYIYSMLSPLLNQGGRMHSGDADIFIVFINWLAIYLGFLFVRTKKINFYWTLIPLIMISSQIKIEGIFLISLLFFMPVTRRIRVVSIAIGLIPFLLWRGFVNYYQIPNDFYFILPSLKDLLLRSFEIAYYTFKEMIKINNWYFFWPVFVVFMIFGWKKMSIKGFILPTFAVMSLLFFASYLFSSIEPKTYVFSSIDRVLLQLSPLYFMIFIDLIRSKLT